MEKRAICKLCKQSYVGKDFSGTSHLDRHHKKCSTLHGGGTMNLRQSTLQFNPDGNLSTWQYDLQRARE